MAKILRLERNYTLDRIEAVQIDIHEYVDLPESEFVRILDKTLLSVRRDVLEQYRRLKRHSKKMDAENVIAIAEYQKLKGKKK